MDYFDLHCDTLSQLVDKGGSLYSNDHHVDIASLGQFSRSAQVFAVYTPPELRGEEAFSHARRQVDKFFEQMELCGEFCTHCRTAADIVSTVQAGKTACLLSLESCSPLEYADSALDFFCGAGVVMASLTHNGVNDYASGVSGAGGLTERGRELLTELARRNIIIDVSHLNFESFYGLCEHYSGRIIASHSNCFSVCDNRRNLKDDMIRQIIARKGLIGINLHRPFVGEDTVEAVVRHISHIISLGGEDAVCMGFDLDGTETVAAGITKAGRAAGIADALESLYGGEIIKKFTFGNALNFFKGGIASEV